MPSRTTTRPTQGQAQAQQVEQPTRGEVLKAELVRAARRAHHHERGKVALLAPVGWLGTLHAAALGMDAAGLHPLLWAGITGVGAVGVLGRAERRGEDLPWAPTAAGALWMLGASIFGPYGWVAIILWVAGIIGFAVPAWMRTLDRISQRSPKEKMPIWGGALGWVRRNDQANPSEEKPEAGELPPEPEPARIWREVVVPNCGDLKGTRLENIERVPGGYSGLIVGTPGVTKFSKITSSVETIASAFGVHVSEVTVEETPDMNSSRAQLTVITEGDEILAQTVYLENVGARIDPETGIAQVGRYFDGTPAHRQFWSRSGGAQMGLIAGGTGSGKSAHGSTLLALTHQCPLTVPVLLDPQGGSSQPDWAWRTPIYAEGCEEVLEQLRLLDYVMARRAERIAHVQWVDDKGRERRGKPFLLPGDPDVGGMPLIVVFLEELRLLLDSPYGKDALPLLGTAVRTWRKPGGSLNVFTQNLGLENFGNEQSLRSNLVSGGAVVAFRTGSSLDHAMVGLSADPSLLPEHFRDGSKTHGLGYITGIDQRPNARMRSLIPRDAYAIATNPPAARLDDFTLQVIEEWRNQRRRGRTPATAAPGSLPTSGDVQAAVEEVLRRAGKPVDMGTICLQVRRVFAGRGQQVSLGEIPAALRALKRDGVVVERPEDVFQLAPID